MPLDLVGLQGATETTECFNLWTLLAFTKRQSLQDLCTFRPWWLAQWERACRIFVHWWLARRNIAYRIFAPLDPEGLQTEPTGCLTHESSPCFALRNHNSLLVCPEGQGSSECLNHWTLLACRQRQKPRNISTMTPCWLESEGRDTSGGRNP